MFQYSVRLVWSDEDASYVATIPEFPGLSAFGDTPEDAAAEARVAAEGFIETLVAEGKSLPDPEKAKAYSGQIRLRLPVSLHERLARQAEKDGTSLNSYMVYLLSRNLAQDELSGCVMFSGKQVGVDMVSTGSGKISIIPNPIIHDASTSVVPSINYGAREVQQLVIRGDEA